MKHAVILLWHKNLPQLIDLINFFDQDFRFYIHIDKKSRLSKEEVERVRSMRNVALVLSHYKINWGGFNILKAEMLLLRRMIKDEPFDYVHFMSGQDYPIKPLHQIKKFYEDNSGTEFLQFHAYPFKEWEGATYARVSLYRLFDCFDYRTEKGRLAITRIAKMQDKLHFMRRIPDQYPRLYGGSNWFSMTGVCAAYVCNHYKRSFYNRLKYTFAPEEMFFPTVIMNSPFAEKVRNDNLRYILWAGGNSPQTLTMSNWASIITTNALFARKFDVALSAELLANLRRFVLHSETMAINSHGCWQTGTLLGHRFDSTLAQAIARVLKHTNVSDIADLGCGPGWYTWFLRHCGYDVNGYDGNPNVETISAMMFSDGFYCQQADLTEEWETEEPFDMVLCLEVGEHIPEEYENILISNIVRNARSYVLLSWAIPGQKGDGHVNCHTNQYVINKMRAHGFVLNAPVSNYLRANASLWWFHETLMFFQRFNN